ncbi:MAG TPA: 6-bladed beta-propeller, partial [Propionibacteriaceae bacterium]|nr:6-bladed beta-propeller [Propionibacteriaceae bacterium]
MPVREEDLSDTLVVAGDDGPCTIVFNEVVTLNGSTAGELPRLPITVGPNSGWVTATYDPGKVAVWFATGQFRRTIGKGPGGGPGEFGRVSDIVVDTARGRIYIFTSSNRIEVYGEAGEYLETISLPRYSSTGALLHDGTVVAVLSRAPAEPIFAVVKSDTIIRSGPRQRGPVFPPLLYGTGDGMWTAEGPWYEIRRHDIRDGRIDFQITRATSLFPSASDEEIERRGGPFLIAFAVNTREGRVFALLKQVLKPGHSP